MGMFGVPGIVSRVCALDAAWMFNPWGVFDDEAEDRRRWCVKELPIEEEKAPEGFKDARSKVEDQRAPRAFWRIDE